MSLNRSALTIFVILSLGCLVFFFLYGPSTPNAALDSCLTSQNSVQTFLQRLAESKASIPDVCTSLHANEISELDAFRSLSALSFSHDSRFRDDVHSVYSRPIPSDLSTLPRVSLLAIADYNFMYRFQVPISAMQCYAARNGYPFIVENGYLQQDRHMYYNKMRAMQKYLPYTQWLLQTDVDVIPLNYSARIEEFIDDSFDIIAADRFNREIYSACFLIKNSPGGRAFLDEWMRLSGNGHAHANYDNGLFMYLLLKALPNGPETCNKHFTNDGYYSFLNCFHQVRNGTTTFQFRITPDGPLIRAKSFRLFEGFFRSGTLWIGARILPYGDLFLHTKTGESLLTRDELRCRIPPSGIPDPSRLISLEETCSILASKGIFYYPHCPPQAKRAR